jgi:hypothetical protein
MTAQTDPTPNSRCSPMEHERDLPDAAQTDAPETLADTLPREIARVTAKKERWQGYMRDHDMGPGMQFSINIMQQEIKSAVRACASGDVVEMMAAHEALKEYSDDD